MPELEKRLLKEFVSIQLFKHPDEEPYLNDECPAVGYYKQTLADIGMTKTEMQKEMLKLRNKGIVEIKMCVDYDGIPHGSGYFLTEKGLEYVKQIFTDEELEQLI
jgi:hypothetical protein